MYSADKSFTLLEFSGIQDLTVQLPVWQKITFPWTGPHGSADSCVFQSLNQAPNGKKSTAWVIIF